jgi:hypothetical protein
MQVLIPVAADRERDGRVATWGAGGARTRALIVMPSEGSTSSSFSSVSVYRLRAARPVRLSAARAKISAVGAEISAAARNAQQQARRQALGRCVPCGGDLCLQLRDHGAMLIQLELVVLLRALQHVLAPGREGVRRAAPCRARARWRALDAPAACRCPLAASPSSPCARPFRRSGCVSSPERMDYLR